MSENPELLAGCGHPIDGNFEWPGASGSTLCLECWEHDCSESWWDALATMPEEEE